MSPNAILIDRDYRSRLLPDASAGLHRMVWLLVLVLFPGSLGSAQEVIPSGADAASETVRAAQSASEVKIWEFAPYEVDVWYTFEKDVALATLARQQFVEHLGQDLERAFRAAWQLRLMETSSELGGELVRDFDGLTIEELTQNELVLVVSTRHAETKVIRTLEAAVESFAEITILPADKQQFDASVTQLSLDDDALIGPLQSKLRQANVDATALRSQLEAGEIPLAFLKRRDLPPASEDSGLRPVLTWLPWQPSAVMRQRDKVLLLMIGMDGEQFDFRAREIDCQMQFLGPTFDASTVHWPLASRFASQAIIQSFAPTARVEDAEAKTALVRSRAGGLILSDENPAKIRVGDVMQPVIRRDDRNGMPVLLQSLSFTYAAITQTDGVKGKVNVYTYSGGPGLQGRQNRRTQRVLLRVRPFAQQSDVQIAVRGQPGKVQSGCFLYNRDLLNQEFELIGRTDWRGRLTIQTPNQPVGILPEEVRLARLKAKMEAERQRRERDAAAKAAVATSRAEGADSDDSQPDAEVGLAVAEASSTLTVEERQVAEADAGHEAEVIYLNQPLVHLYIKSGDMVLASLPYVPGTQPVDVAELPDDSLRLKSEAFVRGFQGEILDLIGLRKLLAARVRLLIKENKVDKAKEVLEELRRLRTFNEMRDQLSLIQRRMLEEAGQDVPRSARVRIDRMFQNTRDMLQKYLQDELLAETERLVDSGAAS